MAENKLYYSMGEVAEMFDVNPSLIRHWESKFDCVKPHKNKKGNRMFSPQDVEKLKLIYHLVKERGMTLDGANKVLKRKSGSELSRDMELLERLQRIRASLVAVREELKGDNGEDVVAEFGSEEMVATELEPSVNPAPLSQAEPLDEEIEPKAERPRRNVVQKITDDGVEDKATVDKPKRRTVRRKKRDEEDKELFPFYEQSLF